MPVVGDFLPAHWHLGIDTDFANLHEFQGLGKGYWDTETNKGRMARFVGIKDIMGKQFIEKELLLWMGAFMPVRATGALGIRLLAPVLPYSPYNAYLNRDQIVRYGPLVADQEQVVNRITINSNWIDSLDRFTKQNIIFDGTYDGAKNIAHSFRGVFTGTHTETDFRNFFTAWRDRTAAPPYMLPITAQPQWAKMEPGDTLRVALDQIRDSYIDEPLDRTFEIQQANIDWITLEPKFQLFGGIKSTALVPLSNTFVMQDAFYDVGTDLASVLTIVNGEITANGTLTGAANHNAAIYHYDAYTAEACHPFHVKAATRTGAKLPPIGA